jgi:ketosteroid isomerase-like protein
MANVKLVTDAYEAFGRGDIPAVLGALGENIAWRVPEAVPHGMTTSGRDGVGAFFEKLAAEWDDFGPLEVDEVAGAGDRVYATGTANGTYDGRRLSYGFIHVWTIEDGVPVRFDEYVDPPAALYAGRAAAA